MARFDTHENIRLLGQELIQAYENAKQATTSGLKGTAREDLVRKRVQSILPGGVGVGTGCVIDSYGNASDQIDIILYEQQFCPIFTVSNTINYYPCEAVIAVGEIKSDIGKKELKDIYKKVASVRKLKRFMESKGTENASTGTVKCRQYLSKTTVTTPGNTDTFQDSQSGTQIYGFGLGQAFTAKPETMIRHTQELYAKIPNALRPNVVLTLNKEAIAPADGRQMSYSALNSSGITFLKPENGLEYLLVSLFSIIQDGVTVPGSALERYVVPPPMTRTHTWIPPNTLVQHTNQ